MPVKAIKVWSRATDAKRPDNDAGECCSATNAGRARLDHSADEILLVDIVQARELND